MSTFEALQHPEELEEFVKIIRAERCKSYLEIGAKFGGSLWHVGHALEPNSLIVAVDLPHGTRKWEYSSASLKDCASQLRAMGHRIELIWGNSTDPKIIEQVRQLAPFDIALIDGDHRWEGLNSDWNHYGEMASRIAFHDIAWHRPLEWEGYHRIDVPQLWESLKGMYRTVEIKLDPSIRNNGIGVLWR